MSNLPNIETLFRDFYQVLHRYAFTIVKDEHIASDIVQNVFATLWEKNAIIEIKSSPKAYLYRCVYNESLQLIRKNNTLKKHHHNAVLDEESSEEISVFSFEEKVAIQQRIDQVLQQLPDQCRVVFLKSRAEQKKYIEIASELNISVKTVEAHMSKALKIIRGIVRVFVVVVYLTSETSTVL